MQEKTRRLSPEELKKLARFIMSEMGIDISIYKDDFIARRFVPRAQALGFRGVDCYIDSLRGNPKERALARRRLFVGTTEFFRNAEVFRDIDSLVRRSAEENGWRSLTALSAPCSTGEEAFSVAMTLAGTGKPWTVVAIDRNLHPLRNLKAQRFSKKWLSKLDKKEIKLYLNDEGNFFSFREELLDNIVTVCSDLTRPLPVKEANVVFMRNFFIYLGEKAQQAAIENVRSVLVEGGFLVLGKVERPKIDNSVWERCDTDSKIFRLKGSEK